MRMPLVSPRENGALCPGDPWDRGHVRGDLGVSGVVWVLLSVAWKSKVPRQDVKASTPLIPGPL